MTETKVLGHRKQGRLDELLKQAGKDSKVNEVIEKEKRRKLREARKNRQIKPGNTHFVTNFEPSKEADRIIQGIENHIGFDEDTGLVKYSFDSYISGLTPANNSLLAIVYFICGQHRKGKKLLKSIEKNIGFLKLKTGEKLIRLDPKDNILDVSENAMLAFAYFTYGHHRKGDKLLEDLEMVMAKNKNILAKPLKDLNQNLCLPLVYLTAGRDKEEGLGLIKKVEKDYHYEFFDENDQKPKTRLTAKGTAPNALLALNYFLFRRKQDEAKFLTASIQRFISFKYFNDGSLLIKDVVNSPRINTYDNLLYALLLMAEQKHLENE